MPLVKREYFIPCSGGECIAIAELIQENIGNCEIAIDIRDNGLYIILYGYKTDVRNAWARIKKLVKSYRESVKPCREGYRVSVEYIVSKTRKTFPPLLLVEILKRMGYPTDYREGYIVSSLDTEEIIGCADKVASLLQEIRYDVWSTTAKYFVVAASILSNKEPSIVIEDAIEKGIMYRDEDDRPRLKMEWRQALDKYLGTWCE